MEPSEEVTEQRSQGTTTIEGAFGSDPVRNALTPQSGSCPTCSGGGTPGDGASSVSYVYALGSIERRFPRLSIEKELAQVIGRSETKGLTDAQAIQKVLKENRYLARQLCWVMTIEGPDNYILLPRDPADLDLLINSVRATPSPFDLDVVIGIKGPNAPPEMCNGLTVPIVWFDQIYSFDRDSLIKAIPRPEKVPAKEFAASAEELIDLIQQMADNAGATNEHRALNYLAVRYPAIYAAVAQAHGRNCSLGAVEPVPSRLSGTRKIVDVVFTYTNRATDVPEKYFVRVDVTEEFPFLVTKLSPYYDR